MAVYNVALSRNKEITTFINTNSENAATTMSFIKVHIRFD